MAINYKRASATTLKLITANGRAVTLVKLNLGAADLNKPWKGSGEAPDETLDATAVFTDPVSEKDLGMAEILNLTSGVKSGELIAFIAAEENLKPDGTPVDLAEYDRLIDSGLVYTIGEVHTLAPGPVPIMFEVRLIR